MDVPGHRVEHSKTRVTRAGNHVPVTSPLTMDWSDDEHLQIGDAHFFLTGDPTLHDPSGRGRWHWESTPDESGRFMLLKHRKMIDNLLRFAPDQVANIVDLGFYKGGSVILYEMLFSPQRIIGVDSLAKRDEALDRYLLQHARVNEVVKLFFGIDQGNQGALRRITSENLDGKPLDLVVDDCSHRYLPTQASLNVLLPLVRPGGLYVIEDWGWAHWSGEEWQGPEARYIHQDVPLSNLVLELVMTTATWPGLIKELSINSDSVYITRGDQVLADRQFDITRAYLTGSYQFTPLKKRTEILDRLKTRATALRRARSRFRHR